MRQQARLIRQGKVRDIYDLGEQLLLVASDRISAFDWVFPTPIPDKGRVLTQISLFWFDRLNTRHHLLSADISDIDFPSGIDPATMVGRSMIVRKCEVVPIECVVRGYLAGSGWREYQKHGTVCGIELSTGLVNGSRLPAPIFTPATKAEEGHDENISFERACELVGADTMERLRTMSLQIYASGSEWALEKGILIADTKFEFGRWGADLILIDEVMTPDSSRFWPADSYQPGGEQFSYDKQFVRNYLDSTDWDKNSPPPELPMAIVQKTRAKYVEAFERLTGETFAWR
jgi:phosphoribosylaminoimidazole-succinocarboxamide synthase